jgi:hypothetical protein
MPRSGSTVDRERCLDHRDAKRDELKRWLAVGRARPEFAAARAVPFHRCASAITKLFRPVRIGDRDPSWCRPFLTSPDSCLARDAKDFRSGLATSGAPGRFNQRALQPLGQARRSRRRSRPVPGCQSGKIARCGRELWPVALLSRVFALGRQAAPPWESGRKRGSDQRLPRCRVRQVVASSDSASVCVSGG